MRLHRLAIAILMASTGFPTAAASQTLYWDVNDVAPGAATFGFADGFWDTTSPNWTTDPSGEVAPQSWTDGAHAVFSAGTDALDCIVHVSGTRTVSSLTIEEGQVAFGGGGRIEIGANPASVGPGAILQIPSHLIMSTAPGHVLTLDGGTLRNTVAGIGSAVYPGNGTQIQLTSEGGILDTPIGPIGQYSIMVYVGTMGMTPGTMAATLTKMGGGEFRARKDWTFTGLDVQEGLYRIMGPGGGETGFGAPQGTVIVAGGARENTSDGAGLGTNVGLTGADASPATRSFVLNGTGDTPDSMIVLSANWTINGPISGPGGLMLNGWARNDGGGSTTNVIGGQTFTLALAGHNTYGGATIINFGNLVASGGSAVPDSSTVVISTRSTWGGNNGAATMTFNHAVFRIDASETIGSLAGGNAVRGVVHINGPDVTLTLGNDHTTTVYNGSIVGTGGLTKIGLGAFAMNGLKSYAGDTRVLAGTLSTNSPSLADEADVYLLEGALLHLDFMGVDTIDSLFINGRARAAGTWGSPGSGAQFTTPLIAGSGWLHVSRVPEPSSFFLCSGGIAAASLKPRYRRKRLSLALTTASAARGH